MGVEVRTGGRLHFGFLNLSLAHSRIYGGLGVAITRPETIVSVTRSDRLECDDEDAGVLAGRAVKFLGVPGANVRVIEAIPRHLGLGSGTQLALAIYAGIARVYDRELDVRVSAPSLDRGGRSGVGVAVFEEGGFVIDAGHPAERFTTVRPPRGEWTVPAVMVRHVIPSAWRFVLLIPDIAPGPSGDEENEFMRSVVEGADPVISDEISGVTVRRLLPAVATGDRVEFGRAIGEIGRLNGVWFTDEQGGTYRPPIGMIVDELASSPVIAGVGQSSWGPVVYGVTDRDHEWTARRDGEAALSAAGVEGEVIVVEGRNEGASVKFLD